jgi:hypothetical protein
LKYQNLGEVAMTFRSILLAWTLAVISPVLFAEESYLVFVDPGKEGEYMKAAKAMAALHDGKVVQFDPGKPDQILGDLKKAPPHFVAFVLPPDRIDVDLCHAILEMATRVDDDPFTDFEYGFITGRDGGAALRFVLKLAAAHAREFGKRAALFGSWEGKTAPDDRPLNALESLGFEGRLDLVQVRSGEAERSKSARKALASYKGLDVLLFFSHGYPDAMSACFRAQDLRDWHIDLSPAILVNCACYNGAPGRWYAPESGGMKDMGLIASDDSVALAVLDAGVSAYVAGIDPWHGPLANQVFCYIIDDGMRLGEATKRMVDRLALDFLPNRIQYKPTAERRLTGEGTENRRHNGAGMILYGDPAWAPYARSASRRMFAEKEQTEEGTLRLRIGTRPLIKGGTPGVDFMLPMNRLIDYYSVKTQDIMNELSMEIYRVLPLDDMPDPLPAFRVVWARAGSQDVPFKDPQLVIEETPKGRLLHIRVPLDVRPMGNLWPMLLARQGITIVLE